LPSSQTRYGTGKYLSVYVKHVTFVRSVKRGETCLWFKLWCILCQFFFFRTQTHTTNSSASWRSTRPFRRDCPPLWCVTLRGAWPPRCRHIYRGLR
jgi:hypothetical protein